MIVISSFYLAYYWQLNQLNEKCCGNYFRKCLCFQGISITFRYHLGTIAVGSSIIAIIDTIRTLIDLIKDRLEVMNLDGYGKCCLTLINGCLSCIRCCFQFFSRYTYIMVEFSSEKK
jgi:choline transporter-like protein 2/4/5